MAERPDVGTPPVQLEVLHLEPRDEEPSLLSARRRVVPASSDLTDGDPNLAAARASGLRGPGTSPRPGDAVWTHSTSWRVEDGAVVLTFLAFGADGGRMRGWGDAGAVDPGSPPGTDAPILLRVLHHAIRHLAFLAMRDDDLSAAVGAAGLGRALLADSGLAGLLPER